MTLAGGSGVISVIAQGIPEQYTQMIQLGLDRKVDEAYAIHYEIMDLTRAIYDEGNPCGIKSLLNHREICQPFTRLPLVPATEKLSNKIKKIGRASCRERK